VLYEKVHLSECLTLSGKTCRGFVPEEIGCGCAKVGAQVGGAAISVSEKLIYTRTASTFNARARIELTKQGAFALVLAFRALGIRARIYAIETAKEQMRAARQKHSAVVSSSRESAHRKQTIERMHWLGGVRENSLRKVGEWCRRGHYRKH
jgi:hypothetical protein